MNVVLAQALARRECRIVFHGTSLTKSGGWAETLTKELGARYPEVKTVNTACDGQNSRWGLEQFEARVLSEAPDIVFIEFAINDAVARFNLGPEESRANLETMLDCLAVRNPECAVVLQVMNPVIDRSRGHDGFRPHLACYEQIYREVAKSRRVILVDHAPAWSALLGRGETFFRHYVPDGLHPSSAGYEVFMLPALRLLFGLQPPGPAKRRS
jgi:acyl-CoA thioesterase-1